MRILAIRVDMNIFFLLLVLSLTNAAEVDNLNILLPELKQSPPTLPLQLISAQDGCYDWTSSQSQIVHLQPLQPIASGCSRQAVVSVNQLGPFSSTLYITAKDAASQSFLSIPVRIRKINKVTIATKSRMMNIKQIQKIELFAFDSDGNTFTSLEGMRFKWQLHQQYSIIESVLIQDAHLFLPLRTRENLQKKGYQSDMIVVRAIAPGNLKVSVRCIEPGYEYLFDQITISVHERFELRPSLIRVATDTIYQLKLVRPNSQQIMLPQSYYRITGCRDFTVDNTLLLKTPNEPSTCTIKVQDTRTKPPYSSTVDIIVESPTELRIITDPLVIVGQESQYHVQLLRNGAILLGQSQKIAFNSDFILDKNRNVLVSQRKGSGKLIAQLNHLKNQVTINSYLPVSVILPENYLHLPVGQQFKLRVIGGTGVYDFQINNDIANINSLAVLLPRSVGQANITVRDRNHPANKIIIHLKVSHISQIQSLQETKEVNRDEWGYLYIIAKNSAHETFTQCHQAQFSISVPSSKLDIDKKVNFPEAIIYLQYHHSEFVQAAIQPTSLLKGKHHQIIAKYERYVEYNEIDSQDLKNYVKGLQNFGICKPIKFKSIVALQQRAQIVLQGEEEILTKVPLRVYSIISNTIQGDNSVFLMTPQSSLKWTYVGGSYNWPGAKTIILVNGKEVEQEYFPTIICPKKEVPSQNHVLKIFNKQTRSLLFPTSQTLNIDLICKFPKKLHLDLEHGDSFQELYIQSTTKINGQVKATDEKNQVFYNSSNVKYQFQTRTGNINYENRTFNYRSLGKNDTVSIFSEQLNSGIHFRKVQLQMNIYVINPINIEHPLAPAQKTIKNISIIALFTPKKPYVLSISQLHPQIQFQCGGAVSCEKGQNYIAVKLNRLGKGEVIIRDKRMYGSQNWIIQFIVVQPDEVIITGQKHFVQEGELVRVAVNNYYKGKIISPYTYQPSYLQLVTRKNIKVVEQNGNVFILRADEADQYQIYGQNTFPKTLHSLYPFNLTVYKQISPNIKDVATKVEKGVLIIEAKTALIQGCRRLIRIQGGPKNMEIKFHSQNPNIKIQAVSNRALSVSGSKLGIYLIQIQALLDSNVIAFIGISVTISDIQSVELQGIEQPVVGAQFRVHPIFKIGSTNLQESTCDFQYSWEQSIGNIKLGQSVSFGLLDGAGINVLALKAGIQVIILKVRDRATKKLLVNENKILQILQDFSLFLPTYINRRPCCQQGSIIMPPSTKYSFDENVQLTIEDGLVHLGQDQHVLQSDKKLGHTTITLSRAGYRPVNLQVLIKNVLGIFIQNQDGYLSIDPHSEKLVNIYLQDNNGRLFISPLKNLDIVASSSNSELLQVKLSSDKTQLLIKSLEQGICTLSVVLPGENIIDSIVVSIGGGLSPSKYIKIVKDGVIQFRAALLKGKWSSSHPQVASVNPSSGLVSAHQTGTTKISYGQLFSTVQVVKIEEVRQVGHQLYKGNSLDIQYQLLWQGANGLQQIPHIKELGPVNNNVELDCMTNHRYLNSKIKIIDVQNHQRLICSISNDRNEKWPAQISVIVKVGNEKLGSFNYQFKPQFSVSKKRIELSSKNIQAELQISTPVPLNLTIRNGNPKWVKSKYQSSYKRQKISIDMQNHPSDVVWWLDLSSSGQLQQVQIQYKVEREQQHRSFWSFKLDWPDYLIILMGIVFGVICYIQYKQTDKIKSS